MYILKKNKGKGRENEYNGWYNREEYKNDRIWEIDGREWEECGWIWKIRWFGRNGKNNEWYWNKNFGYRE